MAEHKTEVKQTFRSPGKLYKEMEYKDGLQDGLSKAWSETGLLYYTAEYKEGKLHGLEMIYYVDTGTKSMHHEYKNGISHGKQISWDMNGDKFIEYSYDHGSLTEFSHYHRGCLEYTIHYLDGKIISKQNWNSEGKLTYEFKDQKVNVSIDQFGESAVLEPGEIIVWKACIHEGKFVIVKLLVPAESKRVTPINDKYKARVDFAQVLQINDENGQEYKTAKPFVYQDSTSFEYVSEQMAYSKGYNDSVLDECAGGLSVHRNKKHCYQWKAYLRNL